MSAIVAPDEEEAYLYAILSDVTGLDIAEFCWDNQEAEDGLYRAWDFQWKWYSCPDTYQVDQGARALGKALALDTPIPTPSGWTTMGEIRSGDFVFDEQGFPAQVLQAHDVLHNRNCFEVVFSDGSTIVADEDHGWETWDAVARKKESKGINRRARDLLARRADAVRLRAQGATYPEIAHKLGYADKTGAAAAIRDVNKPVPLYEPKLRTTEEIRQTLTHGKEKNHSVVITRPLRLPEVELPVAPYTLGAWLGDGHSATARITTMDKEIIWNIENEGFRVTAGSAASCSNSGRAWGYRIERPDVVMPSGRAGRGLTFELRRLGVLNDKRIPDQYQRASIAQRDALLAGLFDTDGYIGRDKKFGTVHCEITFCNQRLASDVHELLLGLGEQAVVHESDAKLDGRVTGRRWRITWRPIRNPSRLSRKADLFIPLGHQSARVTQRRIVDVRPVKSVPVRCITVDSPSHLYLAGRSMIPTHNTVGITLRAFAFPFNFPGQDMLITAPELNHLRPLTSAIEEKLESSWLGREMRPKGKSNGVVRQPHWQCTFLNNAKIISRLPNKDGRGIKGMHVIQIELDEAQDYCLAGWIEIVETLNRGLPGAGWRCHGVPRGVRDKFYEITMGEDDNAQWTVHRPMAMMRPTWSAQERVEKERTYGGSRQAPDYKRNIYGEHGDATNPLFVLARLMAATDQNAGSLYNTDIYQNCQIQFEDLKGRPAVMMLDLPAVHKHTWELAPKGYTAFFAGMDVGVTNHPSEILLVGQRGGVQREQLDLLLRVCMRRIPTEDQEAIVAALFEFYGSRLQTFGIDRTGVGFPVWERLAKRYGERVKGYNFSGKYPVALEDRPLAPNEQLSDLIIERNIVEFASDTLREIVDTPKALLLPFDRELLLEFQGQSYTVVKSAGNPYGKKEYSGGSFHTLDAAKMLIAAKRLAALDAMLAAKPKRTPVLDAFIGAF